MAVRYGYAGRIAVIDLSKEKVVAREYPEKVARKFLGGTGLAAKLIWDDMPPGTPPFSPDNVLVIATGPLTGTLFPQASRYVVAAKSPLTGIYGEAHAAGHFGPELKFAGFDALEIIGRSARPSYIYVEDGRVEIRGATDLWGLTTREVTEVLQERHGRDTRVACIGPAGENFVRFAAVINDGERAAARMGMGAVMGSKRLKAIAVNGSLSLRVADPLGLIEAASKWRKKMLSHPYTVERARYGTTSLVELMNEIGRLPTRNFKSNIFEGADKIGGEAINKGYLIKPRACFACLQRCGRHTFVRSGRYAHIGHGVEFECLDNLGAKTGVDDLEAVLFAHQLCNDFGMDTISTGSVIAWVMECYEAGIITKKDTDGLDLSWGNTEAVITLLRMIALREGLGDVLAEGAWRAAKIVGKGTERYVMHVRKAEIAAQDGRGQKSMGLCHVISERGADHLYAFPVLDEVGFEEEIKRRFGEQYLPEIANRLDPTYKGFMVKECADFMQVVEAVGVCKYGTQIPPVFFYDDIALALKVICGMEFSVGELKLIGERIVNLHRAINLREGHRREDEVLPERFIKEPAPGGPAKGHVVELTPMLREYYELRGWDFETGFPRRDTLVRLGLEDVIEQLAALGKLA